MSFFSVKEVAKILSINEETVRRWIRSGSLNADKIGGRVGHRISSKDLEVFLKEKKGWISIADDTKEIMKSKGKEYELPKISKLSEIGLGETIRYLLEFDDEENKEMVAELFQKKYELNKRKAVLLDEIKRNEQEIKEINKILALLEILLDEFSQIESKGNK